MAENTNYSGYEPFEYRIVNLGVAKADPVKYTEMYANTLVDSSQMPQFAIEASSNQYDYELASHYNQPYYMELEGDIHALALIDLDKEGLSEYKPFLENYLKSCSVEEKQKYYNLKNENTIDYYNSNDQVLEQSYASYSNEDVTQITDSFDDDLASNIYDSSSGFYDDMSINNDVTKTDTSDFNIINDSDIESDYVILNSEQEDSFANEKTSNFSSLEMNHQLVSVKKLKKNKSNLKRKLSLKYNEDFKKFLFYANRIQYHMFDYRKSDEFIFYEKSILKRIRNKLVKVLLNKKSKQNNEMTSLAIEYPTNTVQTQSNKKHFIKKLKNKHLNENEIVFKSLPKTIFVNWDQTLTKKKMNQTKTLEQKIIQNVINLGVARADPVKYTEMYANTLVDSSQMPLFAIESSKKHGFKLASNYTKPYYMELEGDIHALTMIDLYREGLSEYKPILDNYLKRSKFIEQEKSQIKIDDDSKRILSKRRVTKSKLASIETKTSRKMNQSKRHSIFNLNRNIYELNNKVPRNIEYICDKSDQNMICQTISDKLFSDQKYLYSLFNSVDMADIISSKCRVYFIRFIKQQLLNLDITMDTPLKNPNSIVIQQNLFKEYRSFMKNYLINFAVNKKLNYLKRKTNNCLEDNECCLISKSKNIEICQNINISNIKITKLKNKQSVFKIKYFNDFKKHLANIFYLHILPKKIIIQWDNKKLNQQNKNKQLDQVVSIPKKSKLNNNIINLGVAKADPVKYTEMYANTLVDSSQMPQFAIEASSNQYDYELASHYNQPYYMELEGDIHALALIDLDKEGLSEYKPFLENYLKNCSQDQMDIFLEYQNQ